MDVGGLPEEKRKELWDKLYSLRAIISSEYLHDVLFEKAYILENDKEIARIYVQKDNVSIHNKNTWEDTMIFLKEKMLHMEAFFIAYSDILRV